MSHLVKVERWPQLLVLVTLTKNRRLRRFQESGAGRQRKGKPMWRSATTSTAGAFLVAAGLTFLLFGCASSGQKSGTTTAQETTPAPVETTGAATPWPACGSQAAGLQRFDDPQYRALMLGAGLRTVPPPVLFSRMKAAAEKGENYKALYLARVLTSVAPDNAAAWTNRAALAGALGLTGEQAAAQQLADNPAGKASVPAEFLPGRTNMARPVSLADWAGAMNLLADDVRAHEGRGTVIAIKDDLSGTYTRTVKTEDGVTSWAEAKPAALGDILPNVFVLRNAHAMSPHNIKGGLFALALFQAAVSGYAGGLGNTAAATEGAASARDLGAESTKVVSHLKGGSFSARTYPNGKAKDISQKPRPTGEQDAVGLPEPVLWLSGGSMTSTVRMRLVDSGGGLAKSPSFTRLGEADQQVQRSSKVARLPDLDFPRVEALCEQVLTDGQWQETNCTDRVALMELMLREDDIKEMAGQEMSNLRPLLDAKEDLYLTDSARIVFLDGNSMSAEFVGFDQAGSCYALSRAPKQWLAPGAVMAAAAGKASQASHRPPGWTQ